MAVSGDGKIVAFGVAAGDERFAPSITFWDTRSGKQLRVLRRGVGPFAGFALSATGSAFAMGENGLVTVADARSGRTASIYKGISGDLQSLCFSPDGEYLAAASSTAAGLWNTASRGLLSSWKFPRNDERGTSVAFSADSRTLAIPSAGGTELWSLITRRAVRNLPGATSPLAFSADGKVLFTAFQNGNQTARWQLSGGGLPQTFDSPSESGTVFGPVLLATSEDGRFLLSGHGGGGDWSQCRLWNVQKGKFRVLNVDSPVCAQFIGSELIVGTWDGRVYAYRLS